MVERKKRPDEGSIKSDKLEDQEKRERKYDEKRKDVRKREIIADKEEEKKDEKGNKKWALLNLLCYKIHDFLIDDTAVKRMGKTLCGK